MTPLSDALRRIAERRLEPPLATTADRSTELQPQAESDVEALASLPLPVCETSLAPSKGEVKLYCDLTRDGQIAYQAAAVSHEIVVTIDLDSRSANEGAKGLKLFDQALEAASEVRWPGDAGPQFLASTLGVPHVWLGVGQRGIVPREGVLFLEDCRITYRSTAVILSASAGEELEWFAARCDDVVLVSQAETTRTAWVRRLLARLASAAHVRPTCLLVEPSQNTSRAA